jgi:hypothetical protein
MLASNDTVFIENNTDDEYKESTSRYDAIDEDDDEEDEV